jgi:hypothetical protein
VAPGINVTAVDSGPLSRIDRSLALPADGLFCSLDHQIQIGDSMAGPQEPYPGVTYSGTPNGARRGNLLSLPSSDV